MNKNYFCEKLSKGKHGHILYIMIYIFIHEKFFVGKSLTQKRVVLKNVVLIDELKIYIPIDQ